MYHTQFHANSRHQWVPANATQKEPTITTFAGSVAFELQKIASELSKETEIKAFCSSLAAALDNARTHLEGLDEGQSNSIDVLEVLDSLERLCQVSWRVVRWY
jgi:hypothetical protein